MMQIMQLHMIINSTKLFTNSWSRAGTVYYVVNGIVVFIKGSPSIVWRYFLSYIKKKKAFI